VVTFSDNLTFHLNGDDIEISHVANAHTDGDALIHWKSANVLHMGDTFFNGMLPFIDLDSGGSIDGMIAAAGRGLEMANDQTVIIPGHGPVARRSDLERYRDMLLHLRNRIGQASLAARPSSRSRPKATPTLMAGTATSSRPPPSPRRSIAA
jgi:glyoxylase-like metal-dependent hydrolase (beta-lactamase superfamily II)